MYYPKYYPISDILSNIRRNYPTSDTLSGSDVRKIRPSIDLIRYRTRHSKSLSGSALVTLAAIGPTVDLRPSVEFPLYAHLTIWY